MNQNKKILFVFMLILGVMGGQLYSSESNAMPRKVKKQYTKVLQKYVNKGADQFTAPTFALVDIDRNGNSGANDSKRRYNHGKDALLYLQKEQSKTCKAEGTRYQG